MRRADRLVQILLLLRGRRRTTARQLADWLEVTPRTVYRDMADLMASGAPVNGEAGEGYWLEAGFTPPAVAFSARELAALEVGARMLAAWADRDTAAAAQSALGRIHAVLVPPACRRSRCTRRRPAIIRASGWRRYATPLSPASRYGWITAMKAAATASAPAAAGAVFWGDRWLLAAWCGLRQDYRSFRVDRLQGWRDTDLSCPPGISLAGYLGHVDSDGQALAWLERHQRQPWHQE